MTDMINRAFLLAMRAHAGQTRKDGKPYLAHPFSVAIELAKNGADDSLICAGLLHDAIEDGGVLPEELEARFGKEVLRLVLFDTEDKSLSWKERKQEDLRALAGCDRKCAMLVCADKLSNLRDIEESLEREGETAVFARFKRGKEEQEWLYRGCAEALAQLSDLPMYQELTETVETVFCKRRENHAGNH